LADFNVLKEELYRIERSVAEEVVPIPPGISVAISLLIVF
jgi:hypothetical protein